MSVQVVYPWVLFLVWGVPLWGVLAWQSQSRARLRIARFIHPSLQPRLCPPRSHGRHLAQIFLAALGLILSLLAAARPQWGHREETVWVRGRDLVIALDVSRSMLANDVHPSRLERAKADVLDLIKALRGDRAALVAFRRKATLLCPLTTDYAFLRQAVESAGPHSAPPGETNLADAILKAMEAFGSEDASHKAIILISDGEDLVGESLQAAEHAARQGIPIFTVGLGSSQGAQIPDPDRSGGVLQHQGQPVTTRLNNETLLAIARIAKGAYIPLETAALTRTTLGTLYAEHLRKIAAREMEETRQQRQVERYQLFLLPAVLGLMAVAFLSRGRPAVSAQPRPRPGESPPHTGAEASLSRSQNPVAV